MVYQTQCDFVTQCNGDDSTIWYDHKQRRKDPISIVNNSYNLSRQWLKMKRNKTTNMYTLSCLNSEQIWLLSTLYLLRHQRNYRMRTGSSIQNNFCNTNLHEQFRKLQRHFKRRYWQRAQYLFYFNCRARPNSFDASKETEDQSLQPVGEGLVQDWSWPNHASIYSEHHSRAATSCQDTQDVCCPIWCYCIGGKTWQVDQGYKMGGLGSILPHLSLCHSSPRWFPSQVHCTR